MINGFFHLINRLGPSRYLATGGLLLIVVAWIFGVVAEDVATGDTLTIIDLRVAKWFHAHRGPSVEKTMTIVSRIGSMVFVGSLTLLTCLLLILKRRWNQLLSLILTVGGGVVFNVLLKSAFHRERPRFADSAQVLTDYSFPSGHTMAATLCYGTITAFIYPKIHSQRSRVALLIFVGLIILLVALSRIYLGAHYLSDVIGAVTAGLAWLALCLTGIEAARRGTPNQTPTTLEKL